MQKRRSDETLDIVAERWEERLPGTRGSLVAFFATLNALRLFSESHYQATLRPLSLSFSDYRVLSMLFLFGDRHGLSPVELVETQTLSVSGLTRLLDRLESSGLVRRAAHPSDRRSVRIRLTPAGRKTARTACVAVSRSYEKVLGDLDGKSIADGIAGLRAALDLVRRDRSERPVRKARSSRMR